MKSLATGRVAYCSIKYKTRLPRAPSNLALSSSRDSHSEQSVPAPHHSVKYFPLTFNLNLPSFTLKSFSLVLSLSDSVKSHSPSCLLVPFKYWKATVEGLRAFSKLKEPSSLNLSLWEKCSSPLNVSVALLWTHTNSSKSVLCWDSLA